MSKRANVLAERIEQGAKALVTFAESLSEAEWKTVVPKDGRTVGVLIHHVASVYPIEVDLARSLASSKPVAGVTWDAVAQMNAEHAHEHAAVGKQETLSFLRQNSKAAADAVRKFTDEELDNAAALSLNSDAPMTAQFAIEDHALRHSFHHMAKIRAALKR
ncbi:MAG: maleylpyruvate isomerase N-terminal domain-containing protein [Ignavibacteriae bacterium]|nr:maleylpyruvate isomerase N-terminal domain-containing protein [Ignavibacteria bacterium]MBI3365513.1 maleylpyruvate isomerase N-terminal domain-containing protein [Ignavibacteriota bacterium]